VSRKRRSKSQPRHIVMEYGSVFLLIFGVFFILGLVFFWGLIFGRQLEKKHWTTLQSKGEFKVASPTHVPSLLPPVDFTFSETLTRPKPKPRKKNKLPPSKPEKKFKEYREKPLPKAHAPRVLAKGNYAVQVAAFKKQDQANSLIKHLKGLGFQAYLGPTHLGSRGKFYRVWVGHHTQKEDARSSLKKLRAKKVENSFIVTLRSRHISSLAKPTSRVVK